MTVRNPRGPQTGPMNEQSTADRVGAAILKKDAAIAGVGIRLTSIAPGHARVTMTVSERHLNGHGIAHGGFLFLLADAAFSLACNSRGVSTVASGADVTFLQAARLGDELVAEAVERSLAGRSGIYDVTVAAGDVVLAEFRGRSRATPHLPPPY